MNYDICLDAAALLFMLIVAASNSKAYVNATKRRMRYIRLIAANLITLILDIVSTVLICYSSIVPIPICMSVNSLDFIGISITVLCYVKYMEAFINKEKISGKIDGINKVIFYLLCLAHIINLFTGFIFYFDENRVYSRGPAYLLVYAVPLVYFFYGTVIMYKNRKSVEKRLYIATMAMVPIVAVGATFQCTILPDHLIILFAMTLAILMIFFNLETPDYQKLEHTMEQLQFSRQEADAANRSKSDFLANMSHEIRTPMNSIVGMCELILREDGISDTVRDYCYNIQNSGRSLLSIINDILDFTKIESGKMELIEDKFNLASTLSDVVNMAVTRKGEKNIELFVKADPNIPSLLIGDEIRIRQIIINLVSNAVKYTNEGCVLIEAEQKKTESGIILTVNVKDTGIGISEENLSKIFSSFQQVDTKKNRAVEGTGLGLAISKQLINLMGGEINVSSEYGLGSVFSFSIPLDAADRTPFISVKNAGNIRAALVKNLNRFKDEAVRSCFCDATQYMKKTLGADIDIFYDLNKFKKDANNADYNYIVTGCEEYVSDREFFLSLAEKTNVVVVQNRIDSADIPKNIKRIFRPLYSLPLAAVLNGETLSAHTGGTVFTAGFTAPDAKILIVDDNAVNIKVAVGLMRPYRMNITTADSGEAAVFHVRTEKFDLVFMDHMMPVMDGVEATKIIRNLPGDYYKDLPIVALTANAVNNAREMFLASGMNDFLTKPIELSSLDRVLKTWLPKDLLKPANSEIPATRHETAATKVNPGLIFDFYSGITFAGGNIEDYTEILEIFVKHTEEKINLIKDLSEKRDYKNYIIEVHALKSASMTIGSAPLSALAKELEFAGRDGNFSTIEKKTDALLKMYREVSEYAADYLRSVNAAAARNSDTASETREIDTDTLRSYMEKIQNACELFDEDELIGICAEAVNFSCGGKPLKPFFEEIRALAKEFEYDEAAKRAKEYMQSSAV